MAKMCGCGGVCEDGRPCPKYMINGIVADERFCDEHAIQWWDWKKNECTHPTHAAVLGYN